MARQIVNWLKLRIGIAVPAVLALACVAAAWREGLPAVGEAWALVRIVLVFGLMVSLLRKGWSVGVAILVGAGALLVLFPVSVEWRAENAKPLARDAVLLTAIVWLIQLLGMLLAAKDGLKRLIYALGHLLRDVRLVGAIIPSTIGMLPTPGGAMISAPVVKEMGETVEMDPETRTICNYWFRHVWEFWWPLFPAVIYMASPKNLGLPLGHFIAQQMPLSLTAIVVGWFFILRRIPRGEIEEAAEPTGVLLVRIVASLWPVALVAVVVSVCPKTLRMPIFLAALAVVDIVLALQKGLRLGEFGQLLKKACSMKMAVLMAGIYVMRGAFDATQAAADLPTLLTQFLPVPVMCFLVPFIIGLLCGYTFAGVATGFPLLMSLLVRDGALDVPLIALAYTGSFMGVMLSPTHLCLALTKEYFGAGLGKVYGRLALMCGIVMAAMAGVYLATS